MPLNFWFSLAIIPLAVLVAAMARAQSPEEKLDALIHDVWEYRLQESPLTATAVGDHRANDRLDSGRLEDIERRAAKSQAFLDRLTQIDRDALEQDGSVNYQILRRELEDDLAEHRFKSYLLPISNRQGFHVSFPELRREVPLVTVADYENYIARLNDFARYTDDQLALMREGIRQGYTVPSIIMEGSQESVESHIVDTPEQSLMYEPLKELPSTVPQEEHQRLQEAARQAIAASVVPSYQRLLEFMNQEYLPNCRASIAARALPEGREFYRYRVRKFTTLDVTPEEVHQRGLAEVARIREEMDQIIKRVEFDGDFPAFVEYLRNEPKFYASTPEELQKEACFVCKKMDGQLPKLFSRLPRTSYGVRPIPDYIAPKTTAAYYQPPAGDGTRAGFFCINTYDLPSRPLYMLEALALHEAVPGHHLQIALQYELDDLPEFRKFTHFTVFVEGWALYSERLGGEVGFYEDPYSDFGRLSMEIWRACRLVVDTGMHYLDWSRDDAIQYMSENTALSMLDIRSEVDRYIGWPGQALAYKMGELRIRELRQMAEEQLGADFDIRGFHAVVLESGSVPLDVLEANVRGWVAELQGN